MEDDSWSFALSTSSRIHRSALNLSDLRIDFEVAEGDDDLTEEYPCPFCAEDFDVVDLCGHIDDEHPSEAQPAECPVCGMIVVMNMVGHIGTQHGDIFKRLQRLKLRKGECHLPFSSLKKELEDDVLRFPLAGSSSMVSSSKMLPDPLLSFLFNVSSADKLERLQPDCSTEVVLEEKSSDENLLESCGNTHLPPLSDEEHKEKTRRSEFVQGLFFSSIFDEDL